MSRPHKLGCFLAVGAIAILCSPAAMGQVSSDETGRAQAAMFNRISSVIDPYLKKLGLDESVLSYCRTKMDLETELYPTNGSIPFGVDYNKIKSRDQLDLVIAVREAFETNYLKLCLADARAKLDAAEHR